LQTEIGYIEHNRSPYTQILGNSFSGNWISFGENNSGNLYISRSNGQIFKITDDNLSIDNYERSLFKIYPNPVKKNLQSL
jgi:hypothetical protein